MLTATVATGTTGTADGTGGVLAAWTDRPARAARTWTARQRSGAAARAHRFAPSVRAQVLARRALLGLGCGTLALLMVAAEALLMGFLLR